MNRVRVISTGRIPRPASANLKQDGQQSGTGYVLELLLSYAELFFIAKESSERKENPYY